MNQSTTPSQSLQQRAYPRECHVRSNKLIGEEKTNGQGSLPLSLAYSTKTSMLDYCHGFNGVCSLIPLQLQSSRKSGLLIAQDVVVCYHGPSDFEGHPHVPTSVSARPGLLLIDWAMLAARVGSESLSEQLGGREPSFPAAWPRGQAGATWMRPRRRHAAIPFIIYPPRLEEALVRGQSSPALLLGTSLAVVP